MAYKLFNSEIDAFKAAGMAQKTFNKQYGYEPQIRVLTAKPEHPNGYKVMILPKRGLPYYITE